MGGFAWFILANLTITLVMTVFSLVWNAMALVFGLRRVTGIIHAQTLGRTEWAHFFWRRARIYFLSYLLVLSVLLMLPGLLGRADGWRGQLRQLGSMVPGLIAYFVLCGLLPARVVFYPEGFACLALIPFLPGHRDHKARKFSDFRVGLRFWRDYSDAMPKGEVLIVGRPKGGGVEIPLPGGKRDPLLTLAREGLKKAREEKRRARKEEAGERS